MAVSLNVLSFVRICICQLCFINQSLALYISSGDSSHGIDSILPSNSTNSRYIFSSLAFSLFFYCCMPIYAKIPKAPNPPVIHFQALGLASASAVVVVVGVDDENQLLPERREEAQDDLLLPLLRLLLPPPLWDSQTVISMTTISANFAQIIDVIFIITYAITLRSIPNSHY